MATVIVVLLIVVVVGGALRHILKSTDDNGVVDPDRNPRALEIKIYYYKSDLRYTARCPITECGMAPRPGHGSWVSSGHRSYELAEAAMNAHLGGFHGIDPATPRRVVKV